MERDEFADEHPFPLDDHPLAARLTRDEMCEGMRRLADVHDLIGHPPAEVMALLKGLLIERDMGAARVLRWLRTLDTEARA